MKPVLKPTIKPLSKSPLQVPLEPEVKESWLLKEGYLREREDGKE